MMVADLVARVGHAVAAAVWLGAMAYSLGVVQPRAREFLGEATYESFAATLAAGARWRVLGLCAFLAATGGGLVALHGQARGGWWWALIGAKTVALAIAVAVVAWVSWRLWPQRVLAAPSELGGVRGRFAAAALTLVALVAVAVVLGIAARELRGW